MTATRGLTTVIPLALVALLAAGCGDGDDDSELAAEYAEASAEEIADPDEPDEFAPSDSEAACLSEQVVEIITVDELADEDITVGEFADAEDLDSLDIDLPDDAEERIAEAVEECLGEDLVEELSEDLEDQVAGGVEGVDLSCLVENIDDEAFYEASAASIIDADSGEAEFEEAMLEAVDDECVESLMIAGFASEGLTDDQLDCMADGIGDIDVRAFVEAEVLGESVDPDVEADLTALAESCLG